jgi:glycosyltransferase involved in cell wall biosynthesis
MTIDFSVIIPTFRRPRRLLESITSALDQREVTVEVIVIDDSPEGSAEIPVTGLLDSRVRYLKNPLPTGGVPSIVRNIGWPLANGSFLHFLDDDDVVVNGYYIAAKEAFKKHPAIGLVFGGIEPFGTGPPSQLDRERRYFITAAQKAASCARFGPRWAYAGRMLFDMAFLVCSASIVRQQCVTSSGGFDPTIRLMEDADFHVRIMREFGAHFLHRTAIRYRVGSPSLMHSPDPAASQREEELAGRRKMQSKYRAARGNLEFYGLALFTRTILKIL